MKVACANAFLATLEYMPARLRGRRLFEWLRRPVQNDQPSALARTSWRFKRRRYHEKHFRIIVTRFRACVDFAWRCLRIRVCMRALSRVCSLRVASDGVTCAQVGPALFLLVFLAPFMRPRRMGLPFKSHRALPTQDLKSKAHREQKTVMAQGRAMPADISLDWRMSCMCQVYISGRQKKKMKKLCHTNSPFEHKRLSQKPPELLSRAVHCPSP